MLDQESFQEQPLGTPQSTRPSSTPVQQSSPKQKMGFSIKPENPIIAGIVLVAILLVIATLIPELRPHWGNITLAQPEIVTVTGVAQSSESNQIATYTAGVTVSSFDKEQAVADANAIMSELLVQVEEFGIPSEDLQTQNLSIYQFQEWSQETNDQRQKWTAENNLEITLRDTERVAELADLLTTSRATNVYGPSFRLDETNTFDRELIEAAMEDARSKADRFAATTGRSLGKVVQISEGSNYNGPYFPLARMSYQGGGGGASIEPGTSSVIKTVTVTYELK